ncbi:MAG TPA: hypothetical protein VGN77_07210 [Steroidobacteraceae bacterium]|nr:hypothetical protein [Steroidobacteraceae bacterium]
MSGSDSTMSTGTFELILEEYAGPAKLGYGRNPYDAIPKVRDPSEATRQTDLRRLSEWIRTKKHVEELKDSDEEPLP